MSLSSAEHLLTILEALRAELQMHIDANLQPRAGLLVLWLHDVSTAVELVKKEL
jgi:hypothetical protein